ncbi:MAG: hypothetical protein NTX63_05360 [Candidatus Peregrinibacteria bacterium]|nr:hypothetical protein [Candidatus Peregrinibacteria bacterium]
MNTSNPQAAPEILPETEQVVLFNKLWRTIAESPKMHGANFNRLNHTLYFEVDDPEHHPNNPTGKFQIELAISQNAQERERKIALRSASYRHWADTMRKGNIHFTVPLNPDSSAQKTLEAIAKDSNGGPALSYVAEKQGLEANTIILDMKGNSLNVRTSEHDRQTNFGSYQGDFNERWYHELLRQVRLRKDYRGTKGIETSYGNFFKLNPQSADELQTRIVLAADHIIRSLLAGETTLENDALAEAVSQKFQALQTGVRGQISQVDTSFVPVPSISWQEIEKENAKLRKMGVPI